MQLYVDRNRAKTEKLLEKINGLGLKAIFVTVDAAAPGKREADERSRAEVELVSDWAGISLKSIASGSIPRLIFAMRQPSHRPLASRADDSNPAYQAVKSLPTPAAEGLAVPSEGLSIPN